MKNLKKGTIALSILIALLCVTGCKPAHKVCGTDLLRVYEAQEVNNDKYGLGKYRYSITDGTGIGWQLQTDSKFEIGDHLKIVKKET